MADPLSITASVLGVVTAAIVSTRALIETVSRFKGRDKTLQRLQDELEDLVKILDMLKGISQRDLSMMTLLEGPIGRCSQLCAEFNKSISEFTGKPKAGFRDWAKLEFRRGDIHDFIDTVSGYRSTISVGLGAINLHTSKASQQILEEYDEMIKDTTYNLNLRLQRIDEKIAGLPQRSTDGTDTTFDLNDERAVTERCLRICEDAGSYLESLTHKNPFAQPEPVPERSTDQCEDFEAQRLTRQVLAKNRDSFAEMVGRLRERLDSLPLDGDSANNHERTRLTQELDLSKQCLEICKVASDEVVWQKKHTVGEAIADEDSDQVVVTTLADLFNVGKAESRGRSAQLIGSMTDESLQRVSEGRYSSRFGALSNVETTVQETADDVQRGKSDTLRRENMDEARRMVTRPNKANSHEFRRRALDGRARDAGDRNEGAAS